MPAESVFLPSFLQPLADNPHELGFRTWPWSRPLLPRLLAMKTSPLDIERSGNLVVARFQIPNVDAATMQQGLDQLLEHMRYDNVQHFILDMQAVEYMASACLSLLLQFRQDIEHIRGRIVLARCQERVAMLFKLTRLDQVFTLCDDLETARNLSTHPAAAPAHLSVPR